MVGKEKRGASLGKAFEGRELNRVIIVKTITGHTCKNGNCLYIIHVVGKAGIAQG
ncbi:MAG: hypothetical protein ACO2OY_03525 [Thermodesulfobacteriaceae bacterium]